MILNESKRDELLLPYLNIYKQKTGRDVTLGKFKEMMLYKLGVQGGLQNLSKSSNYYLVGATKYYFNGDLTNNNDLSIFHENFNDDDDWNREIGVRLNACINILRNAYIDSIGTQFEQPEDFGVLTLPKLLRKYNAKINAALGIVTEPKKKKEEKPEEVVDTNVGKGYTFDILYKYDDATKYNVPTQPGAWCITYGSNHFNGYVRRLGIHYVIFLKNGYQNIKRPQKPGRGFTYGKPHDEYGNSMIAMLQSNNSWEPVYITSRWNHGAGGIRCEADHAYTTEEFCQITGVTKEDLQRIYEIWLKNKDKRGARGTRATQTPEERERALDKLRKIKYAQMRINGGEDPNNLFAVDAVLYGKSTFSENPGTGHEVYDFKNSVYVCTLRENNEDEAGEEQLSRPTFFLVDKGNVVFETVTNALGFPWQNGTQVGFISAEKYYQRNDPEDKSKMHNIVLFRKAETHPWLLYDTRRHAFLEIDGVKRFKYLPTRWDRSNDEGLMNQFYEVKLTENKTALVKISNNLPLRLPNGRCWFNNIKFSGRNYRNHVNGEFIGGKNDLILAINAFRENAAGGGDEEGYDTYFYSVKRNRFIDMPKFDKLSTDFNYCSMDFDSVLELDGKEYSIIRNYSYSNSLGWEGVRYLVDTDGNLGKIGPYYLFDKLYFVGGNESNYLIVRPSTRYTKQGFIFDNDEGKSLVYDKKNRGFVRMPGGEYLYCYNCSTYSEDFCRFGLEYANHNVEMICKMNPLEVLLNPFKPPFPSKYSFWVATYSYHGGGDNIEIEAYNEKPQEGIYWWHHDPQHEDYFKRVLVELPLKKLKSIPLKTDPTLEGVVPQEQINESNIREMVSEILKRMMENGK